MRTVPDEDPVAPSRVRRMSHDRADVLLVADVSDAGDAELFLDEQVAEELGVSCVAHIGNEENVRTIMTYPAHTGGSDGILVGDRPHPRSYGTFPRYLALYVRELGIIGWEQAIRKLTSLPAQRLGFHDRGLLRPELAADVVCLDPDGVRDTATYEEPRRLPEGIPYVIVNGRLVVDDGSRTDELPGRALRSRPRGSDPARTAA